MPQYLIGPHLRVIAWGTVLGYILGRITALSSTIGTLRRCMRNPGPPGSDSPVLSHHRFKRPALRLWLPLIMLVMVGLCGWFISPTVGVFEFLGLLFLLYVAISALVAVAEIAVTEDGLLINRMLLPKRLVPWEDIDRVIVFAQASGETDTHIEIASISVYEGLSPLNRLPGLVYGQGFRQTIMITPDAIEDYDTLLAELEEHCVVIWR